MKFGWKNSRFANSTQNSQTQIDNIFNIFNYIIYIAKSLKILEKYLVDCLGQLGARRLPMLQIFEIGAMQKKCAIIVKLEKCSNIAIVHLYVSKAASIHPRTSPPRIGKHE